MGAPLIIAQIAHETIVIQFDKIKVLLSVKKSTAITTAGTIDRPAIAPLIAPLYLLKPGILLALTTAPAITLGAIAPSAPSVPVMVLPMIIPTMKPWTP